MQFASNGNAVTDSRGLYSWAAPRHFTGQVTPFYSGGTFAPSSRSYNRLNSNQYHQDYVFSGTGQSSVLMSGFVYRNPGNTPGVNHSILVNGNTVAVTGNDGSFSFAALTGGSIVVTTAIVPGESVLPASYPISNVQSPRNDLNFVVTGLTVDSDQFTVDGTWTVDWS